MSLEIKFDEKQRQNIIATLRQLPIEIRKKTAIVALRAAADVIVNSARKDAIAVDDPATPNNISKNIVRSFSRKIFARTGNPMYRVGVLGGAKYTKGEDRRKYRANPGLDTFYWRFVNFGFTARGGARQVAGKHFFGKQLEKNAAKATQVFADKFERGLTLALRKARRKP